MYILMFRLKGIRGLIDKWPVFATLSFVICTVLNKQNDILNVHQVPEYMKCRGLTDMHHNLGFLNRGWYSRLDSS